MNYWSTENHKLLNNKGSAELPFGCNIGGVYGKEIWMVEFPFPPPALQSLKYAKQKFSTTYEVWIQCPSFSWDMSNAQISSTNLFYNQGT